MVSNKSKTQLSGGTIYARAGVSNDDRSYGMRILGTGSTLTMTKTEDAAQPRSLYVTGRNTALYATALADGGLLPEITASSAYDEMCIRDSLLARWMVLNTCSSAFWNWKRSISAS